MLLIDNFLRCVTQQYADFNGRTRRRDWVLWFVALLIINAIFGTAIYAIGLSLKANSLLSLILLLPNLAIGARRLHDVGKSGWWWLINLVPLVGTLYFLYLMLSAGQVGPNQYGEDPKATERY